ncbi:hypothetical protein [uncultured Mediterranean phage uvMED]|nr:hypothetical protein [uncultured Mediterranean phage uvMED]
MKKAIITPDNAEGLIVDMTAEEITQAQADETAGQAVRQEFQDAEDNKESLKASAKAKLIAGEPLTEAEANTIVLT